MGKPKYLCNWKWWGQHLVFLERYKNTEEYELKKQTDVVICIMDITGKILYEILLPNQDFGNYTIRTSEIFQDNLSSGVYFFKLSFENGAVIKKLIVVSAK